MMEQRSSGGPTTERIEQIDSSFIVSQLCRVLKDGIDIHRCQAARGLGRIAAVEAVPALIEALLDEDEDVRTDAAEALARIADPRAAKQLLENLIGDPCPEVKLAAIEGLARLNEVAVVPYLRQLARSRDTDIVSNDDSFFETGWDDWTDFQVAAIKALAEMGRVEAVDDIVFALDDADGQDLTEVAFNAFAKLRQPGALALGTFLDDPHPRVRRRAATAVGRIEDPAAKSFVSRALMDIEAEVRLAVGTVLATKNPGDPRLEDLLRDENPEVRAELTRLCAHRYPERLATLTSDGTVSVRRAALKSLADHPDLFTRDERDDFARVHLENPDPETAASAVSILGESENSDIDLAELFTDNSKPVQVRTAALRGLVAAVDQRLYAMIDTVLTDDRAGQIRFDALAALAGLARKSAWPNQAGDALISALNRENAAAEADEAIEREQPASVDTAESGEAAPATSTLDAIMGGDRSVDSTRVESDSPVELTGSDLAFLELTKRNVGKRVVREKTSQSAIHIPRFAAGLLGDFPNESVASSLAESFAHNNSDLRLAVVNSLVRIGEELGYLPQAAIEALTNSLAHRDRDLRRGAVRALGASAAKAAASALFPCLSDEDASVRTETIGALGRIGENGAGTVRYLEDRDPFVRLAAAKAVAAANGPDAVDRLAAFAFSFEGHHRRETAKLLRQLDVEAANKLFVDVLRDDTRLRDRQVAMEVLEELNAPPTN